MNFRVVNVVELHLCRLLLREPDVLLLDEPTNHLDAESIQWLEMHLAQYKGTVICITHDRYFLDNVAGWILELDRGQGIPWKGNYTSWLEQKAKRLEMEEKTHSKRRKTLERELEWVRMAPKARHAKSKARLGAYDKMLNEDVKQKEEKLEIFIPNGPRLGDKVIEMENVSKGYGERILFEKLSFQTSTCWNYWCHWPKWCWKNYFIQTDNETTGSRFRKHYNWRHSKNQLRGSNSQSNRSEQIGF